MFSFQNQDSSDNEIKSSLCAYTGPCKGFLWVCKGRQFHVSVTHYSEPEHKNKTGGSYCTASATSRQTQRNHKLWHGNKATSSQTSPDRRWANRGPTGFCQFWAGETAGHLISKGNKLDALFTCCTRFLWPTTMATILSAAWFFVHFF